MSSYIDMHDGIDYLVPEWERLARRTETSPFLWPGWISAWWRAFGAGQLQIIAAYEHGRLTGVLPLHRLYGRLGSTTNYHTPLFGFLAEDEVAVEQLSRSLFSRRPRRVDLGFLSPTDLGISQVRNAAADAHYQVFTELRQVAPYVDTDEPWEAYEKRLRRKFRSELRRRRRRLEEEGRLTLELSDGTHRLGELLEEGFRIEGSGWKQARGTSINSHMATRRFYTEVAQWASERGWLRLAFLRLDGQAIAFDFCLECNRIHYLLKTGYDPAYRQFAPGMLIRHLMLTRAFSDEISTYDFLGDSYGWKQEWTHSLQGRYFMRMFASTTLGSLDRAVFVHGRPAAKRVKRLAGSILGAYDNPFLSRGSAMERTTSR